MKTSMYLSETHIEILGYDKKGSDFAITQNISFPLEQHVITNGIIKNAESFVKSLVELKNQNPKLMKNVSLVLDSNAIRAKKVVAPKLNKKECHQFANDEMMDALSNSDVVYGFDSIDKKGSMFICGVERKRVGEFIEAFKSAEINLTNITVGVDSINNYVKTRKDLAQKTFVFNIVENIHMLSVLFHQGKYAFSTRTRLVAGDLSKSAATIVQSLFTLTQFAQTQKLPPIEASYYIGLDQAHLEAANAANTGTSVQIMPLPLHGASGAYEMAYLGIFGLGHGVDLLKNYQGAEKLENEARGKFLAAMGGLLVVSLLSAYAFPTYQNIKLKSEIKSATTFIESMDTQESLERIDLLSVNLGIRNSMIKQIDDKLAIHKKEAMMRNRYIDILMYTHLNIEVENAEGEMEQIELEKFEITGFTFDAEKGHITSNAKSKTERDASLYVEALKKNDEIDDVRYTGYSYNREKEEASFSIEIALTNSKYIDIVMYSHLDAELKDFSIDDYAFFDKDKATTFEDKRVMYVYGSYKNEDDAKIYMDELKKHKEIKEVKLVDADHIYADDDILNLFIERFQFSGELSSYDEGRERHNFVIRLDLNDIIEEAEKNE